MRLTLHRPVHLLALFILLVTAGCQAAASPLAPATAQPTQALAETRPAPSSTAQPTPTAAPQPAAWPTGAWQASTPEQQGMDSGKLAEMFAAIRTQGMRLHSLLIVRNGYLVTEAYFNPYTPEVRHTVESNTKSVIAALVGIAIQQGKIKSVDQKMIDFFPGRTLENMDARKGAISLGDLLSMQPGLDCADGTPGATGMYNTRLWVQYLQDLPMTAEPGKQWIYCSGAAHLLSAILQETTGMDARSYANQTLFAPLGIAEVGKQDWGADPEGITNGIAGLYLTPRELAKLGYLYLNRGNWDGKQVVPAQWMDAATREQAYIGKDPYVGGLDRRFGYMFSIFPEQKYYGYLGMAGQELFVLPEQKMVVVFNSSLPVGKEGELLSLINDYIVPSVKSDTALPEAPKAYGGFINAIANVTLQKQPIQPLPEAAMGISGKTFVLDENPLGWKSLAFTFTPGSAEAVVRFNDEVEFKIGLDGGYRLSPMPGSKPNAIKGAWGAGEELNLELLTLGEYPENSLAVNFTDGEISLSYVSLNFGGDAQKIHGVVNK